MWQVLLCCTLAAGQDAPQKRADNLVYVEAGGIPFDHVGAGLSYERRLADILALRGGIGMSSRGTPEKSARAATLSLHLLGGRGSHWVDLGAGVAVAQEQWGYCTEPSGTLPEQSDCCVDEACTQERRSKVFPALTLGYRFHPWSGGPFVRASLNLSYIYLLPYSVALGWVF